MQSPFKTKYWLKNHEDAKALALLAIFFVAVFPQALFGGKYIFTGDGFFYSYPLRTVAWAMIRNGQLPLWTPYVMSGYPLLSMAQLGLAYPFTWGYLFLPGRVAEQIYVLAPFLFAPIFTYAYLRELGRSSLGSLLGALTFGYGGMMASHLAGNGFLMNATMWLPLLLIALERARRRLLAPCLLFAALAYTMSVVSGVGQGFLYTGLLAVAYACFLVLVPPEELKAQAAEPKARLRDVRRFAPLFVACGSTLLAAGVAAFQLLETARAFKRSVRSRLSYEAFTQGSYTPGLLWRSVAAPLFYGSDTNAYVPPLALVLMVVAVYKHGRRAPVRDLRVFFWAAIAVLAVGLMLGAHTPLYRLVYHTPLLNRFRVPSRHTFEWTFSLGVLAAYGWDAAAIALDRRRNQHRQAPSPRLYAALALLASGAVCGTLWWWRVQTLPTSYPKDTVSSPMVYCLWKTAFVLLIFGALWRAALIVSSRWRVAILTVCVLIACYVEPGALVMRWLERPGLPASRFAAVSDATRYLAQFPPVENRIFTRVDLMAEQYEAQPRLDAANVSAIYGLHNVAGYEPLILERYSRALGDVGLDTVRTPIGDRLNNALFGEQSRVLDLLNCRFVVSYTGFRSALEAPPDDEASTDLAGEMPPQTMKILNGAFSESSALVLVTSLANAVNVVEGEPVATLRIFADDGRIMERELRAGVDTAEWAHDRKDVRARVRHKLAPIFDQQKIGGAQGYAAYRFQTRIEFNSSMRVIRLEIHNISQTATLAIFSAKLVSPDGDKEFALHNALASTWRTAYEQHETLILRNTRALPRVWLVAEAEAVDSGEALRRIRGESTTEFDPRRTALLEVRPGDLPLLPGGTIPPNSTAQIVGYQPNRLRIETNAPTATVLMVSEIFYPGWEATVDNQPAQIKLADYLLRGLTLTAGRHTVEMRYTAPAARTGAAISALTLLVLGGLGVWALRTRGRD
jgi:Bacterial membrane protein YfhO